MDIILYINNIKTINASTLLYDNRRFFSHIITIGIPLLFYTLHTTRSSYNQIVLSLLIIMSAYYIINDGSRGTSFSLLISFILLIFFSKVSKKKMIIARTILLMIIIPILLFLSISILSGEVSQTAKHLSNTHTSGRISIWINYFNSINLEYLLPQGFDSFKVILHAAHPHNLILFTLYSIGAILAIPLLSLYYYKVFRISKQLFLSYNKKINFYLLWMLLSINLHALVSGLYIVPFTMFLLIIVFSLIKKSSKIQETKRFLISKHYVINSLVILLSLILCTLSDRTILTKNSKTCYPSAFCVYMHYN